MPIRSLHHVSFAVTDLAATRRFAEDFGLRTVNHSDGRLVMPYAQVIPVVDVGDAKDA